MSAKHPRKVRVDFRKNRAGRRRQQNLTQKALEDLEAAEDLQQSERLTGKGDLVRRRTVMAEDSPHGAAPRLAIDDANTLRGRVLRAIGANHCRVELADGRVLECTVRRLVRTLARQGRNAVVAGDEVLIAPTDAAHGLIVRVEPRKTTLSRGSDRHEHVIVANVDQAVIVASAAEPSLKPALIDRFLVSAEKGGVRAIICLSKVDLGNPGELNAVAEVYAAIGYDVVRTSTRSGEGIELLRDLLKGRESVLVGQSGVGKSSLINALDPGRNIRTSEVSGDSGKGRHTTRTASLLTLPTGGWIVDTPGVRQMQLWDVSPAETEAYFREFLPFIPHCRFPDCTHSHETGCAVKAAVEAGTISPMRYHGYLRIVQGDEPAAR